MSSYRGARLLPNEILIFQHLAKTGGTTLGDIFLRNIPVEEMLPIVSAAPVSSLGTWAFEDAERAVLAADSVHLARIRFVGGHVGFGIHTLLPRPARYVTLVRDPVERLISAFYYSVPDGRLPGGETVTFADYVRRTRHYDLGLNNGQVRVLSGLSDLDPPPPATTETARLPTDADFDHVTRNMREHFVLVGVTERFDEFLVILCRMVGWHLASAVYRLRNVTLGRPLRGAFPAPVIAELERQNTFDRRLHEFAQGRLDEEIVQYGAEDFLRDLERFRRLNDLCREGAAVTEIEAQEAAWR